MIITHETWTQCRADYITGRGSLREVAARHGIGKSTVEKKARAEGWAGLREQFEAVQLQKLLPAAATPMLPPAPVAPDGTVSPAWLAQRVERYYRENAGLVDQVRALLAKKLACEKDDLSMELLTKLTTALGGIVDAESKLYGLNHRPKGKPHRTQPKTSGAPEPEPMEAAEEPPT